MDLIQSIKVDIKPLHEERLRMIDQFDYTDVSQKVSDDLGGLPASYLARGIENLKLYDAVALLDPLNVHAVSRPVDSFWHAHVLFTREYVGFCRSIFGQHVHHQPLNENDGATVEKVNALYKYTLELQEQLISDFDKDWWGDMNVRMYKPVCLHMELVKPDIRDSALFPAVPAMQVH